MAFVGVLAPSMPILFRGVSNTKLQRAHAVSSDAVLGNRNVLHRVRCMVEDTHTKQCDQTPIRRSANYRPPIWSYDYIQSSIASDYMVTILIV